MCSRSSILIFHIYIYIHTQFFFTLFSYKSNSHQAEKRGYLCGVWCRQEQVIGVLYTVHLLFEFSAIWFIVFLPLKEIHPCLKNIHGPNAWEIRSNPPPPPPNSDSHSIFPPLIDPLILPLTLKKDTPSYTGHGFCPYIQAPSSGSPRPECMKVSSSPDPEPSGFLDWKWARICGKKSRIFSSSPPAESSTRDCNVQPGRRALF